MSLESTVETLPECSSVVDVLDCLDTEILDPLKEANTEVDDEVLIYSLLFLRTGVTEDSGENYFNV